MKDGKEMRLAEQKIRTPKQHIESAEYWLLKAEESDLAEVTSANSELAKAHVMIAMAKMCNNFSQRRSTDTAGLVGGSNSLLGLMMKMVR